MLAGAIFDKESTICRTAFRYEAEQHNNSTTSRFKLDRYVKEVSVLGNFELSKAGICISYIYALIRRKFQLYRVCFRDVYEASSNTLDIYLHQNIKEE